jgi:hypothetical protein
MRFPGTLLVAPASRRQFCGVTELRKSPEGRRRYQEPLPTIKGVTTDSLT